MSSECLIARTCTAFAVQVQWRPTGSRDRPASRWAQTVAAFTGGEMNCRGKGQRRAGCVVCRSQHTAPSCSTTQPNEAWIH